ncbi:MAG: efflux RND transporter periplasmic adaptor subunit [Bacteroidota bacterium]
MKSNKLLKILVVVVAILIVFAIIGKQQGWFGKELMIGEASYKVAQTEVEAAAFSVKSAEASLSEANGALVKTTVYAPMSGTISLMLVEQGERVVGTEMMTGTEVLRIADLSRMEAQVQVNENDIIKVSLDDTALIEVDAYLDHTFKGVVTEIEK